MKPCDCHYETTSGVTIYCVNITTNSQNSWKKLTMIRVYVSEFAGGKDGMSNPCQIVSMQYTNVGLKLIHHNRKTLKLRIVFEHCI